MNNVTLIGRLTKDPEIRYTSGTQMCVATFTIAIDRPKGQDGEKQTDFPRVTCFGKQAENCERYLARGRLVGVQGRIQTGSYQNKDGVTVYTTDVVADRVEFLEWADRQQGMSEHDAKIAADFKRNAELREEEPEGFQQLDEDVPF
jgi:single-stranded DNA-binding protein